jgi:hypothetical protein
VHRLAAGEGFRLGGVANLGLSLLIVRQQRDRFTRALEISRERAAAVRKRRAGDPNGTIANGTLDPASLSPEASQGGRSRKLTTGVFVLRVSQHPQAPFSHSDALITALIRFAGRARTDSYPCGSSC